MMCFGDFEILSLYNISLTFNDGGLWLGGGGLSGLAGEDEGLPVFSFSKPRRYSRHLG